MTYWKRDSILNSYNNDIKPSEIFKEVCDSIGSYYTKKGWKYSRNRPKITYNNNNNDLTIEISFWSSRSNMADSYV